MKTVAAALEKLGSWNLMDIKGCKRQIQKDFEFTPVFRLQKTEYQTKWGPELFSIVEQKFSEFLTHALHFKQDWKSFQC